MYKYSKLVKERMLGDNFLAFFWMMYRIMGPRIIFYFNKDIVNEDFEEEISDIEMGVKQTIFEDFDSLAMNTLKKGQPQLLYYILKKQNLVRDHNLY